MPYHIPKQIHTGFQDRSDTYTGKLSFSTYVDEKTGKIKHDSEWDHWCQKQGRVVLDNKPMTGFMFNRNKTHRSSGYNFSSKRIVFRIYHPSGFEFEIKPDNVNLLLEYTDISKKEIADPCIIAFTGKTIVLLPVSSPEYQDYIRKEEKRNQKSKLQNLKKEVAYKKKDSFDILIYAGKYDFSLTFYRDSYRDKTYDKNKTIKNIDIFYNLNTQSYEILDMKKLSTVDDFAISKEHRENLNINPRQFNYSINQIFIKKIVNPNKQNLLDNYENFYIDCHKNYINEKRFASLVKDSGKLCHKETIFIDEHDLSVKTESFQYFIDTGLNSNYNKIYTIDVNMPNGKTYSLKNYLSLIEQVKNMTDGDIASLLLEFSF